MYGAMHFHISGFAGSITITEGADTASVTPKKTDSVWRVLSLLATTATSNCASTYSFSIANNGILTISSTGTFNLAMSTEIRDLCKFASTNYNSVTSVPTSSSPDTSFAPYTDGDGVLFMRNLRAPLGRGFETFEGGHWNNTPGTELKFPLLAFSVLRADLERFLDVTQKIGTPSKVDVLDDGVVSSFFLGSINVAEQDPIEGWTRVRIEVAA